MMRLSTLLLLLCSCASPTAVEPEPPEPSATHAHEEARSVAAATRAWRARPGPELHSAVLHAAERGLEVPHPSQELDVALGDALANVLLRPDLGLPRLERHRDHLDGDGVDAYLDAVARTGDLPRLALEVQRVTGVPLDAEHPTARVLSHQAAMDPHTGWQALRDAVRAAELVEIMERGTRRYVDRPVPSVRAAMEVLVLLLPGWELEVATARSALPSDPDPLLTPGQVPAFRGKRLVLGYARLPADLRPPGVALDLRRPAQVCMLAARANLQGESELLLGAEGTYREGVLWLYAANDPERVVAWTDATEALMEGRLAGATDEILAQTLRDRFGERLLEGR